MPLLVTLALEVQTSAILRLVHTLQITFSTSFRTIAVFIFLFLEEFGQIVNNQKPYVVALL